MSSEFDMSFEDFLNYDFDAEVLGSGFDSHDTEGQQKIVDHQMLDFSAGDFGNLDDFDFDNLDDGALGQSSSALIYPDPDRTPWTADAGSSQSRAVESQETVSNSGLPPDSTVLQRVYDYKVATVDTWSGATKCLWPKCSSKATFKTPGSWRTHIRNIHVNPLTCTEPQCSYKRPFGKECELRRHISTAHGTIRNYKCPIDTCEASITGFARKDKLMKHLREEHEHLKCLYNHCSAVILDIQQESHISQSHGDYECAVGGCEKGDASRFSLDNLRRHLRRDHCMTYDPVRNLTLVAKGRDGTVRIGDLRNTKELPNCATCSLSQSTESVTPSS